MKLIDDNGREYEISTINGLVGNGDIILKSERNLIPADIEFLEKEFSKKFGKKVIIIDGKFSDVFVLND